MPPVKTLGKSISFILGQIGADLTQPQEFYFEFIIPSQDAANALAKELESRHMKSTISPLKDDTAWLCSAIYKTTLDIVAMNELGLNLEKIAAAQGGTFNQWRLKRSNEDAEVISKTKLFIDRAMSGETAGVREQLESLLSRAGSNTKSFVQLALGTVASASGYPNTAAHFLDNASQSSPENPTLKIAHGEALIEAGRFREVYDAFSQIESTGTLGIDMAILFAVAASKLGKSAEGLAALTKACAHHPSYHLSIKNSGRVKKLIADPVFSEFFEEVEAKLAKDAAASRERCLLFSNEAVLSNDELNILRSLIGLKVLHIFIVKEMFGQDIRTGYIVEKAQLEIGAEQRGDADVLLLTSSPKQFNPDGYSDCRIALERAGSRVSSTPKDLKLSAEFEQMLLRPEFTISRISVWKSDHSQSFSFKEGAISQGISGADCILTFYSSDGKALSMGADCADEISVWVGEPRQSEITSHRVRLSFPEN